MKDSLDTLYKANGFTLIELSSGDIPLAQKREWSATSEIMFNKMFPEHERHPSWSEMTQSLEQPSDYIILILGRETEGKKETAALTILREDKTHGVVNLEYLARDPDIKVQDRDKRYAVSGGYMLQQGFDYARQKTDCNTLAMECELPSSAIRNGTEKIMDPVERIKWYTKQGYEMIPVDDSKTSGGLPIWCHMAKSLRGLPHPDYAAIAEFTRHDALDRRNPATHTRTLQNLQALAENPNHIPEDLSQEMRDLIKIVAEAKAEKPSTIVKGGTTLVMKVAQMQQPVRKVV